eukprot:CAMPEP_0176145632 /NCGR_PEP_ID=MMETSP0120_2-20121206/74190_1 /TAXON_ID=160619 /ORGANISM="Kryptoperidinium foliaceum, Strain CCMP 1326" /LENGTH=55 /DNA_ID=CAMNT_0017482113 /DNA_START=27 /DNA_END=194 /DNA_ORIENTATION=+
MPCGTSKPPYCAMQQPAAMAAVRSLLDRVHTEAGGKRWSPPPLDRRCCKAWQWSP